VRGNGASVAALELEGTEAIDSTARSGWPGPAEARLRISRATPVGTAEHFLITPYQYGMAIEYPGTVEAWVKDFSINGAGYGNGARLWVRNDDDTGGILMRARNNGTEAWGEIATRRFMGAGQGPLRLRTVEADDGVEIWSGPAEAATRQVMLGTLGPSSAAGIRFGPSGDTSLYRAAQDALGPTTSS
jgi:hypothetical protein